MVLDKDTTHVVSYWKIPGGCDYAHAWVCIKQACSEEEANQLANALGREPPEMAMVMTVADFQQARKNSRGGKKAS